MKYFIFRNNTIENLFGSSEIGYSGYEDISCVPESESFIWFYQVPVKFDTVALAEELSGYFDKFRIIHGQIPAHKRILVFSLQNLYDLRFCSSDFEITKAINRFNQDVQEFAIYNPNVKFIDFSEFIERYPNEQLIDWKYYFISQMVINPKLAGSFRKWFASRIAEMESSRKKCLVLDLDNTLWHGILGEDGIDGIGIGGDYPGKAFLYFQEALIELSKRGVLLTVCSKNNESDVLEAWNKNPFIKLNLKYISAYRINWLNKADNIKELAKELNIGLDSFVFVDDNPTERELVRQMLPMVEVPEFPEQPYLLPSFFSSLVNRFFRLYAVTEDDKKKTEQYRANASRKQEQLKFNDFDSYLESLEIELDVMGADDFNLARIAQMTQKTNQFNLTTKRYADTDVRERLDKGWFIYCVSVRDKFGDNGITGAVFLEPIENGIKIDSCLVSCRILGKGIEFAFMRTILNDVQARGLSKVQADYYPTPKNGQVAGFYDKLGLNLIGEDSDGAKHYESTLVEPLQIESYYEIKLK